MHQILVSARSKDHHLFSYILMRRSTRSTQKQSDNGRGIGAVNTTSDNAAITLPAALSLEQFRYHSTTSSTVGDEPNPRNKKRDLEDKTQSDCVTRKKKRKISSKYAPPSKYAHLPPLQDVLEHDLICVFVGTNPGVTTATSGHAYAHPSNLFWKLLHSSGCTDVRLRPTQDRDLPRLYSMGNTNIVSRASKDAAELSKAEMAAGTPILEEKFRKCRPEAVCIVGKGIWEAIWRWRYKREIKKDEFKYGWQDDKERMGKTVDWPGSRVFVASSTSGLSASLRPAEKEAIWRPFGEWVKSRRQQRSTQASSS